MMKKIKSFYKGIIQYVIETRNIKKRKYIISSLCAIYCISMIAYMFFCFKLENDNRGSLEVIAAYVFYIALYVLAFINKKPKQKNPLQ